MNPTEEKIFEDRYWHAARFCKTVHIIYAIACGSGVLAGVILAGINLAGVNLDVGIQSQRLWILVVVPVICYPLSYIMLFSKWSPRALLRKIRRTTAEVDGTIEGVQTIFGFHQINYSYTIDGKKRRGFDAGSHLLAASVAKGDHITVSYTESDPKISMLKQEGEQAAPYNTH